MSFGGPANSEGYFYDYDENGADDGFRWPSQFCREDPFWTREKALPPNDSSPAGVSVPFLPVALTQCLQEAVIAQIPPLFLLFTLPVLWTQLANSRRELRATRCDRTLPRGILTTTKNGIIALLFGLKTVLFLSVCYDWLWKGENVPIVELMSPVTHMATLILLLHYSEQCRSVGLASPGTIFCTWLLFVAVGIFEFLFWLRNAHSADFVSHLVPLIWWPLCCLQLIFHLFTESVPSKFNDEANSSPESRASFVSRQFFLWLDPLVWRGYRKPLTEGDVFELEPSLKAQRLFQRWTLERQRQLKFISRAQPLPPARFVSAAHSSATLSDDCADNKSVPPTDECRPLLGGPTPKQPYGAAADGKAPFGAATAPSPTPSIIVCLWRLFKWEVIGAMLLKVFSDLFQFASPILLGQLITFTEDQSLSSGLGYLIAVCLFIACQLRSLFLNNYFVLMFSVGCKVQSVLTSAVFAKTLRLSNGARRGRTSGEIQNLMAIDVDRFQQITPLLQQLWSAPFQITVALILLYQTIGWAVVGGLAVMLLLIPCNFVAIKFTKRWQMEQMKCKDQRLRMTNEVLGGIRAVKLYAWETPMMRQIEGIRKREINLLRKSALLRATSEVLNVTAPTFVSILSFAFYVLPNPITHPLTPAVAFVSLTLFSQLRLPMIIFAELVAQLVQTSVSNRRLKEFMVAEEVEEGAVQREQDPEYERAVDVEFASFDWQFKQRLQHDAMSARLRHRHSLSQPTVCLPYTLNNIELHLRRGLLTAIVGKVGCGKSSLISAILGEMHKVYGYVGVRGTLAYVPQQPWILNRTIRENIIFPISEDEKTDEQHYAKIVEACALQTDFAMLPDGDQTEIGEKGINLSGGQKARVNLARALYRRANIYLLDDPLSAVDAIVGRHIFDKAIGPSSLTKGCTRILVTHSLAYLNQCDWIVVLDDGQVKSQGIFADLLKDEETAKMIVRLEAEAKAAVEAANLDESDGEAIESDDSTTRTASSALTMTSSSRSLRRRHHRISSDQRNSLKRSISKSTSATAGESKLKATSLGKLVKAEGAETGHVQLSVYSQYFAAMRWPLFIGFTLFMVLYFVMGIIQSFWLTGWSDDNSLSSEPPGSPKMPPTVRLGVYAALSLALVIFLALSYIFQIVGSVNASIRLHGPLLERILHAPVSFFDTTPLGRVLNRFGKEFDTVDLRLGSSFRFMSFSLLMVLQVMIIVAISTPLFILLDIPICAIYFLILMFFIPSSRQLQRLTSISRSPLYNMFAEVINGATSIRAFGVSQAFSDKFCNKLDAHIRFRYFSLSVNRWLSIRIELIGNIVILATSALAVLSRQWGSATAGLIGLSVSRSLDISAMFGHLVRTLNDFELGVVSVERVLEYMKCPQEASWYSQPGKEIPEDWPGQGEIRLQGFSCRYRPELDLSLRSINADIRPQEKVGVVGRTGAGKTSFALALFRIVEAAEGRILIDRVDISRIGLQELRSRITIIPQDPVLFAGTLRFNLDPFEAYSDNELWTALEHVHLKEFVQIQHGKLSHPIAEGGENISVGQRQLLCLARAILRRTKIIVMDEATASIDSQTDALIQNTIRTQFQYSTVITIAHRISTVMDYDRIMVLSGGRLVEFDTPTNLMANKDSQFHELVKTNEEQAARVE